MRKLVCLIALLLLCMPAMAADALITRENADLKSSALVLIEDTGDGLGVERFLRGEGDVLCVSVPADRDGMELLAVDDDAEDCAKAIKRVCSLLDDEVDVVEFSATTRSCKGTCKRGQSVTAITARP
jgi:hypothetical protein